MKRPLFWASCCMIIGTLVAFSQSYVLIGAVIVFSLIMGGIVLTVRSVPRIAILIPAGAILGLSTCLLFMRAEKQNTEALFAMRTVSCTVTEVKETSFTAVPQEKGVTHWRILVYCSDAEPEIGDIVLVHGPLTGFSIASNDGEWDAAKYYRSNCYIGLADSWEGTGRRVNTLRLRIARLRSFVSSRIDMLYPKETSAIVKAVLYCDKSDLSNELSERYRQLGIAHILAVSGLHVTVFGGFLTAFFLLFLKRAHAEAVSAILLFGYGALTGFPVSCARAVFTSLLAALGRVCGRTPDRLSNTMLCAAVFLLCKPVFILQQGFLLSFYCAFVLIRLSVEKERDKNGSDGKSAETVGSEKENKSAVSAVRLKIGEALRTGIRLSLFLLPLQATLFYTISPFTPFLNVIILPALGILLPAAAVGIAVSLPTLLFGKFLSGLSHYGFAAIDRLSEFLRTIPCSVITCGSPGIINLVCFAIVFCCIELLRRKRAKYAVGISMLAFLCFLPIRSGNMIIYNLSVGQGDCCVVVRGTACVVIDCGSTSKKDVGEKVLLPFLRYHGIEKPDLVILSHTDADHVNGVAELLEDEWADVTVAVPIIEKMYANSSMERVYGRNTNETDSRIRYLSEGDGISVKCGILYGGRLTIASLFPDGGSTEEEATDRNANSLVVRISDGQYNALFTGDCDSDALAAIAASYPKELTNCDYLKVAHHGSVYSAEPSFYEILHPAVAVVSVGSNSYGHPSPVTLDMIRGTGASVYVTKTDGQVTTEFARNGIQVTTFLIAFYGK